MDTIQEPKDRFGLAAGLTLGTVVVVVAAFLTFNAFAAGSAKNFVRNASIGNQFEILSSQMALQKSGDDDVKQFAQRMIDDHSEAGKNLETAVSSVQGNVGEPQEQLDAKHQKMLDKLSTLDGAAFDKEYIGDQTKAHNEAVSLFRNYAKNGKDDALKNFATETLPTLEDHHRTIKDLKASYSY